VRINDLKRSFTELVLRLFALLRVTIEGFRTPPSVILSAAKNLVPAILGRWLTKSLRIGKEAA